MVPTYPIRREFCRRLFRVGGATEVLRNAFLDALADAALAAQSSGRAVQATSVAGASTTFQFFDGWEPSVALTLIDEARAWAAAADVNAALALIGDDVTSYGFRFYGAGGFA